MIWRPLSSVNGTGLIQHTPAIDARGAFYELMNRKEWVKSNMPLPWSFPQVNVSHSLKGVLRGFHIQKVNPQAKLVTCVKGKILDICLDVRRGSPTYMGVAMVQLEAYKPNSFFLPAGTAHAFLALEESTIVYHCSTEYDAASDGGFNALDPEVMDLWPDMKFIRSDKDRRLPSLDDYIKTLG